MSNSGGASETGDVGPVGGQQAQQFGGGEIQLSKAESAALTAIHFGARDPRLAMERARKESGLTHQQIQRLQARAKLAREQGVALRGERFLLKPTKAADPDIPGLLRDDVAGKDDKKAKAGAKAEPKKEPYNTMRRSYAGRKVADAAQPEKKVGKK